MFRWLAIIFAVLVIVNPIVVSAQSIEGVWSLVEREPIEGAQAGRVSDEPGLLIVSGNHYSLAFVNAPEPRPSFSDSMTAEDRLAVFYAYVSNAGTYERDGSALTFRPLVAVNPVVMADGSTLSAEITDLTSDSLEFTGPAGPLGRTKFQFSRVD